MGVVKFPNRFEVFLISLDPTVGSEIQKTRPCVIVSPDEMNQYLRTVIVAPLTTGGKDYPTRIPVEFEGRSGRAALDQIRAVDRDRLLKKLGNLSRDEGLRVLETLSAMFAE